MGTKSKVVLAVLGFFAVLALITVAGWGIRYVTAAPKGKLGAYEQKESAINRVQKQEMFEQLIADIDGYSIQRTNLKTELAASRGSSDPRDVTNVDRLQASLTGLGNQCISAVQQYNAEARKYSARDFRSADLPSRLDATEECLS